MLWQILTKIWWKNDPFRADEKQMKVQNACFCCMKSMRNCYSELLSHLSHLAQLVAWLFSWLGGTGFESRLGWPFIPYQCGNRVGFVRVCVGGNKVIIFLRGGCSENHRGFAWVCSWGHCQATKSDFAPATVLVFAWRPLQGNTVAFAEDNAGQQSWFCMSEFQEATRVGLAGATELVLHEVVSGCKIVDFA